MTVTVLDPLELPDGSLHSPGSLTLCSSRALSPIAELHQVSVDGVPVGYLLSRTGVSEGPASADPLVTFHRDRAGRLHLVGYAWPAGKRSRTYLLRNPAPAAAPDARAESVAEGQALVAAIAP